MGKSKGASGPTLTAKERRVKGVHSSIDDVKLKGKQWKAAIGNSVLSAELVRTIEGASHIEIGCHDPELTLLEAALLEDRFDIELDGLWFRFTGIKKSGDTLTLIFEDREVAYMREYDEPRKAFRDEVTRAQFVLSLVREVEEVDIPVHIPELNVKQPIATAEALKEQEDKNQDEKGKGLPKGKGKDDGKRK